MTLPDYLQQYYTKIQQPFILHEINNYTSGYPQAAEAVYKDVMSYTAALRTRYGNPSTLNRILCSIKAYYDYLCYTGLRSDNPARSIKHYDQRSRDIQLQDLFTAQELEALLHQRQPVNKLACRNQVLISLLIYQALQPAETEALTLHDINLSGQAYTLRQQAKPIS